MNALLLPLLLAPLSLLAQPDTTRLPPLATFRADTLKPIDIREFPYTYTTNSSYTTNGQRHTSSSIHTGLKRIYSYDGIDIDRPDETLKPTILAIQDPDATKELITIERIQEKRQTNVGIGMTLSVGGLIMLCVGASQSSDYKKALNAKVNSYYATPSYTTSPAQPLYASCSTFYGFGDPNTGVVTYTCATDSRIKTTDPTKGSYPIPGTSTGPTTVFVPHTNPPTSVDMPNGMGWLVAGTVVLTLGFVVACLGNDGIDHFHKAVQYYNRAISRKISWRLEPYSGYGGSGLTLRGRF